MISVGEDFRFGKQRSGTATDLQAIAARFGIPVNIVPLYTCDAESPTKTLRERISSSSIRQALSEGNIKRAKELLDRPYTLTGTVVKGQQLGRTIGFPTANIQLPANKFLPRHGVYAVRVFIEGERQEASVDAVTGRQKDGETVTALPVSSSAYLVTPTSYLLPLGIGVMNIGYRPTVNGTSQSVEVHLLDWSGDLYGKTLTVQLKEFLRSEQKFASLEALKAQILADCAIAKSLLIPEATEYETVD
jgi:riboflavin kinase/FMN adenylyltransferase